MRGAEPSDSRGARALPAWWAFAGVAILAAGLWAVVRDLEGWNAVWYLPAWYGYLLLVDAAIHRLQGHSFLSHRRRELGAMMLWSVPFWYLFEAYNLVLENWYYVFVLHSDFLESIVSVLAFATVLPACFFHAELVKALGWWREVRFRQVAVGPGLQALWLVLGIASLVLPLVLTRLAFWMVWFATLWLPDLVNYRLGAPSFLRDLEAGRGERIARLVTGGLLAGLAWELFNYWARCKWIYTVPGFEEWKLFEMPVLGFLGFPVLALEAFAFYTLVCHLLRGGRSWERSDADQPAATGRRWVYAAAVAVSAVLCLLVFRAGLERSVQSRRPLLAELQGLDEDAAGRLRGAGVPTPERLSAALAAAGPAGLAGRAGLEPERLERAGRHAALALHKGMGARMARLLHTAGVAEVGDLAELDADDLHRRLLDLAPTDPPRLAEVRVWVRAARLGGAPRR